MAIPYKFYRTGPQGQIEMLPGTNTPYGSSDY